MTARLFCMICGAILPPSSTSRRKFCPDCALKRVRAYRARWYQERKKRA